jgi:hypothetical protein
VSVEWREHAGLRYLHVDYRGVTGEDQLTQLASSDREILRYGRPGLRILTDVRGAAPAPGWLLAVKRSSAQVTGPLEVVQAVVGVDGVRAAMLRGYNAVGRGAKAWPFASIPEALEFLASGRTFPGRRGPSV